MSFLDSDYTAPADKPRARPPVHRSGVYLRPSERRVLELRQMLGSVGVVAALCTELLLILLSSSLAHGFGRLTGEAPGAVFPQMLLYGVLGAPLLVAVFITKGLIRRERKLQGTDLFKTF